MTSCPSCGTPAPFPGANGHYPVGPAPYFQVSPQFPQGQYPVPGYVPYPYSAYWPPDPKRTAASAGCTLMVFDGALAFLFSLFLFFLEPVVAIFLLAASVVAIAGGWMGPKGIMPLVAVAGPSLLVIAAVLLISYDPWVAIVGFIGLVIAVTSLALVIYGWGHLVHRAEARRRGYEGGWYPPMDRP